MVSQAIEKVAKERMAFRTIPLIKYLSHKVLLQEISNIANLLKPKVAKYKNKVVNVIEKVSFPKSSIVSTLAIIINKNKFVPILIELDSNEKPVLLISRRITIILIF